MVDILDERPRRLLGPQRLGVESELDRENMALEELQAHGVCSHDRQCSHANIGDNFVVGLLGYK